MNMYEIGIPELMELIREGHTGVKYALANRDALVARKHTYTLYGPHSPTIGASIPTNLVPAKVRQLKRTNRRKNYIIYELDDSYKVLRTILMLDYTECDCVMHHFELDGVTYAYHFSDMLQLKNDRIDVLKYQNGQPIYCAEIMGNYIFAQFCEYTEQNKMRVATYSFSPESKHTQFGYPVDWNAPIGALNSPVSRSIREEPIQYIDFSYWFEGK